MRTKTRKKLLTFFLASGAGIALFFSHTPFDAQQSNSFVPTALAASVEGGSSASEGGSEGGGSTTATKKDTDSKQDFADTLEIVLKIIYLLLWPFLALAGLALDNGMVYGTYFQLDSALFTFWNIVKNFANFALGFLFLTSILQYIFNFGKSAKSPLDMIRNLLIAGVGIQASWFVIGGLIDVSTVATVGIGGLPLQLLKDQDAGKKPVFGIKANLNISDIGNVLTTDKGFVILYTYQKEGEESSEYYLPCAVKNQKLLKDDEWASAFGVPKGEDGSVDSSAKIGNSNVSWSEINKDYCMFGNNILSFSSAGDKIEPGSDSLKQALKDSQDNFLSGKGCSSDASLCQTISNIAQKGKGYQGAFYALYGSLLNLGSINVNVYKSNGSMAMEAIIKAIIGIAYLFPLLVLCVVLIIRVAVLWIMIAFSPILVLAEVFGYGKKLGPLEKYGIKNVIALVFLPVIVTFAISISIVFLSVLSEGLTKGDTLKDTGMETSSEGNKTCMNLVITKLCIDNPAQDIGISGMIDFFPWIILNICGIGLMRTILMTAMKGNQFTEKTVGAMDAFAKNMIKSAPIIPFPGGATSVAALGNSYKKISSDINDSAATNAATVVSPTIQNLRQTVSGQKAKGQEQINAAAGSIKDKNTAKQAVQQLLGPTGALYNPTGGTNMFSSKGNNLDLEQYGDSGVSLVNKLATVGGLGAAYKSVDDAFSDKKFLEYLNKGLGLNKEEIRSLYTGRGGEGKQSQQAILAAIDALDETTASQGTLSGDHTTYTDAEGATYTLTGNGFSKKTKDGKKTTTLTKPENWDELKISKDDLEKMKKKFEKDSPSTKFTKEFEQWLDKNSPSTPAPTPPPAANTPNATPNTNTNNATGNTTTTNTNQPNTTPVNTTTNNTSATPTPPPANPTTSTTGAPNPGSTTPATPATGANTNPAPANNTNTNTSPSTPTPPANPAPAPTPTGGNTPANGTPPTP